MIEVTFIDTGKTYQWTRRLFYKRFGKPQALEILAGYLPHIVAVEI